MLLKKLFLRRRLLHTRPPLFKMLDLFKQNIADQVSTISGVERSLVLSAIENPNIPEHGDFAIAIPRLRVKGNPAQLSKDWAAQVVPNEYILSSSAAGPFLNFKICKPRLRDLLLPQILKQGIEFGTNKSGTGKRILVEFSSPNIAKPFHAGHLRSTIIGNYVRNVFQANGYETIAMNYLGDWGKQYGLLAVGFERFGSEEELLKDAIKHLYDVYVQINKEAEQDPTIHDQARAYFKRMEEGDKDALALWERMRELSITKYVETYDRLNIQFDVYSGESKVNKGTAKASELLKEAQLLQESDGAMIVDLKKEKLGTVVVQKKDGTTLYITRDIGAAIERYEEYKFDEMYYVVASQQDLHLKQLFKILEKLGFHWAKKCHHISYGLVQGMSTRKGTAVFLEDILEQSKESMHEQMQKNEAKYAQISDPDLVAHHIGLSAMVVQDMSARRIKNYTFDWGRMFSFEGDTGPYLQYAHARLCSIQRKAPPVNPQADLTLLVEAAALELVDWLAKYPSLVLQAKESLEPCNVVGYSMHLAHLVSQALESLWVMGQEEPLRDARLVLYHCAQVVLGNALRLIGLKPLERM